MFIHSSFERSLVATSLGQLYLLTLRTRKPIQYLNGVPSKPFTCCLVALALPGLLWLLWGKRMTAVSPMHCIAGTWLHPPAPFQTGRKRFGEGRSTYRRLSLPPQPDPRMHPWTACRQKKKIIGKFNLAHGSHIASSSKSSFAVDHGSNR
jgi:hypothetical protein